MASKPTAPTNKARVRSALMRRLRSLYASVLEISAPSPPRATAIEPRWRILFVCHGNICRSPMAEGILRAKLAAVGAFGAIAVDSAGTGGTPAGRRADGRARATILRHGSSIRDLRARPLAQQDFDLFDLILAMDEKVRDEVVRRARSSQGANKVRLLLDYAGGGEIRDPVDGTRTDFEQVYEAIERACDSLAAELVASTIEAPSEASASSVK